MNIDKLKLFLKILQIKTKYWFIMIMKNMHALCSYAHIAHLFYVIKII